MKLSNELRLNLELSVCRKAIQDILAAGYYCRVWDGEEWATTITKDEATLIGALRSTDDDIVYIHDPLDKPAEGRWLKCGWVRFIYGNMPYEVIADNTDTDRINALLKGAEALQDAIAKDLT